jgi:transcriptional regulator with XRE-family HTH domain
MSPAKFSSATPAVVQAALDGLWARFGERIRTARIARRWTRQRLADEASVSRATIYLIERGEPVSVETAARVAGALRLRLELAVDDGRPPIPSRAKDLVHAAMGELEAGHLRRLGHQVAIDEPYQHYQFAGRADVLAWDIAERALLHLENRTQFPNLQEAAGSWNAKRAYLADSLAMRLRPRGGWRTVTHVMVALWSAEALHALRLRIETFRSLCPDPAVAFEAWWSGKAIESGDASSFIVLDPLAAGRQRTWLGLDDAVSGRPRVHGYADAAERLRRAGRA